MTAHAHPPEIAFDTNCPACTKADRARWRREFDTERAKTVRLEHDLQRLRALVDQVLDSSGEEFYIAFGALHAERQARTVPVDTGTRHP